MSEFSVQRGATITRQQSADENERLGFLVHELRNSMQTATLAVKALETGNLPISGATGSVLKRSLAALTALIDHTLSVEDAAGTGCVFTISLPRRALH